MSWSVTCKDDNLPNGGVYLPVPLMTPMLVTHDRSSCRVSNDLMVPCISVLFAFLHTSKLFFRWVVSCSWENRMATASNAFMGAARSTAASGSVVYEGERAVHEYLQFHFGRYALKRSMSCPC